MSNSKVGPFWRRYPIAETTAEKWSWCWELRDGHGRIRAIEWDPEPSSSFRMRLLALIVDRNRLDGQRR